MLRVPGLQEGLAAMFAYRKEAEGTPATEHWDAG
jgi:hypothetical protein